MRATTDCKKTPNIPTKCCNCSGKYPTSYSSVPQVQCTSEKRAQTIAQEHIESPVTLNKNLDVKGIKNKNLYRYTNSQARINSKD